MADLVFFIKNARGEYVVVNQTLVERCGKRKKSELIGRRPDELFPLPLGRSYRAQDEEVVRSGVAIRNQLELHLYPTGRRGWCLTNKLPLRRRGGGIAGLFGFSRDLQAANERSRELALRAGLSVYQFDQRMRRIFGITAGQLIQKTRMEAALQRLRDSDASMAAIASESGYSDQSAFTRRFHQTIGMSPSEYRQSIAFQGS